MLRTRTSAVVVFRDKIHFPLRENHIVVGNFEINECIPCRVLNGSRSVRMRTVGIHEVSCLPLRARNLHDHQRIRPQLLVVVHKLLVRTRDLWNAVLGQGQPKLGLVPFLRIMAS